MELFNPFLYFLLGFIVGGIFISFIYQTISKKKINNQNDDFDLGAIKTNIENMNKKLTEFNLVQDRLELSLVKGSAKGQGDWGEFVLKNILENSGLKEPHDYETQKIFKDSDGLDKKPDVVVHMPGKRDLIIDSKVTLKSWHEYANTKDEKIKSMHFKNFLESVKTALKSLEKANYQKIYDIDTLDYILMFIPVEPAFIALCNDGNDILQEAWKRKIAIVCPSTLPWLLRTVDNLWRIDKQSKTAQEIANKASDMYDKVYGVYQSFNLASRALDTAKNNMKEAQNRLQDGKHSLTKQAEKIKQLGRLSPKKNLPIDVIEDIESVEKE
jgi:DNA recombination protein RmuC